MENNKIENGKYTLDIVREWINNVDMKISILLAFAGILFGYIFTEMNINILNKIIVNLQNNTITLVKIIKGIIIILEILSCSISILSLLKALRAKINIKKFKDKCVTTNSLIFYGNISNMTYNEYKNKINNQSEESYYNDIYSQVYITSMICNEKFKYYNIGVNLTAFSVILLIIIKVIGIV